MGGLGPGLLHVGERGGDGARLPGAGAGVEGGRLARMVGGGRGVSCRAPPPSPPRTPPLATETDADMCRRTQPADMCRRENRRRACCRVTVVCMCLVVVVVVVAVVVVCVTTAQKKYALSCVTIEGKTTHRAAPAGSLCPWHLHRAQTHREREAPRPVHTPECTCRAPRLSPDTVVRARGAASRRVACRPRAWRTAVSASSRRC